MARQVRSSQPLFIFPIIAGSLWCLALSVLLIRWLSQGRPRLPSQIDPRIAFVSDIAALELKPFFVLCCIIVAVSFVVTIVSVHRARFDKDVGPGDAWWRQFVSWLSIALSVLAAICLVGLSLFDAISAAGVHAFFLNSALAAIGACGICVDAVWWDLIVHPDGSKGSKYWCRANCILTACLVFLALLFVACLVKNHWFIGGILEWMITYLGAVWLVTFTGFLEGESASRERSGEHRPLIS